MSSSLTPFLHRILVKPIRETETASGLVLPQTMEATMQRGEVVAIGVGRRVAEDRFEKVCVEVGQNIIFPIGRGFELVHKGETFHVIEDTDIIVIEE